MRRLKNVLTACCVAALFGADVAHAQQTPTRPGGGGIGRGGGIGSGIGRPGGIADRLRQGLGGGQAGQTPGGPGRPGGIGGGAGAGIGGGGGMQSQGDPNAPVQSVGGGGGSGLRIVGGDRAFEPAKDRPVVYEEIPRAEQYEPVSLIGPQPITQFLDSIALATGWNVAVTEPVQKLQLPFFQINAMSPAKAIELLQDNDIYYTYDEEANFLKVMTIDEYVEKEYGELVETVFDVEHADLEAVETVLTAYKSPRGVLMLDPRTSTVYVRDTRDNIDFMEKAVRAIDVPVRPRTFQLRYINADAVVESIEQMLSDNGEMQIDPRSNQLTVTDLPMVHDRIEEFLEQVDRKLETRSWILSYAYPEVIADHISLLMPEEMGLVTYDEDIHQLTVSAVPQRLEEIDELIALWDIPRAQVQIEAYLLTTSTNVARNLGINWAYFAEIGGDLVGFQTGNAQPRFVVPPSAGENVSIGQLPWSRPLLDPITGEPLTDIQGNPLLREFRGSDVSVVINYLDQRGDVTILAQPRVTVQDGQEALFENTTQVPFSQSTADRPISSTNPDGTFGTTFRSISRIDFIDVGTILRVLPKITETGNILMEISAEDSSFVTVTVTGAGEENTVPQKTQNRVETQVMVNNEDTVVIGGLRSSNFSDNVDKVPLLGDLPLLGRLFRSTIKDHGHSELLIFLTPTIVDTRTSPESRRLAEVEAELGDTIRTDAKNDFERIRGAITNHKDEISVAIGQNGAVLVNQTFLTMDGLREIFAAVESPLTMKVVIRKHPRAPEHVVRDVIALAEEADLAVVHDQVYSPFVPAIPNRSELRIDIADPEPNRGVIFREAEPAPEPR